MTPQITEAQLNILRGTNTPTIANAMERLKIRDRLDGFTRGNIRSIFPDSGVLLGFAVTICIRSATPPTQSSASLRDYWESIQKYPLPRVVVAKDLDHPPAGAWWGEMNANIHRALGCIGVITDGTVRDLDEVRPLGFQMFAAGISVSHCWAHLESFGQEVTINGMSVKPGDLIHADKHGAITIPLEHVHALLGAIEQVERHERPIIQLCKSESFSIPELDRLKNNPVI